MPLGRLFFRRAIRLVHQSIVGRRRGERANVTGWIAGTRGCPSQEVAQMYIFESLMFSVYSASMRETVVTA